MKISGYPSLAILMGSISLPSNSEIVQNVQAVPIRKQKSSATNQFLLLSTKRFWPSHGIMSERKPAPTFSNGWFACSFRVR